MALNNTGISYVDKTWNPFGGCTPFSAGCLNWWARETAKVKQKNPKITKYREGFKFKIHPKYFDDPIRGRKAYSILVNSMSDTFHEDAPLEVIQQIFDTMVKSPRHTFLILTKRAERMAELREKLPWPDNVWAGVTVERADYRDRLDCLRKVRAKVRFISFEPLLGPIPDINFDDIHWAIVGGESGDDPRPMILDWARGIREQCRSANVPFYFKQVGGNRVGKGGCLLDGGEWKEFPKEVEKVRRDSSAPKSETDDSSDPTSADGQSEKYVERYPTHMFFSRENPTPVLKKIRVKEVGEMPKEKKPAAGAEENTVKESSDQVQKTLPAVVGEMAPAEETAPTVDAKLIEEAVRFINEKYNETVYKGAMEIGAYVLKHFFNDDIVLASSRNPRKATSYRALCQSEGLIPRPETLSVMVRVAAQEKFFLSKKLETDSLSYTHKAELVKIPNDDEKVKLVKSVIKKALSSRQLEDRIETIKKQRVKEMKPIAYFFDKEIGNPQKLFGDETVRLLFENKRGLQQELRQMKAKKLKDLSVKAAKKAEETRTWAQFYQDLVDAIEEISEKK